MSNHAYYHGRLWSATVLFLMIFMLTTTIAAAQQKYKLSLADAVQLAQSQNKWVQTTTIEENATGEDRKDVYQAALPSINVSASYQRFSDLTLFSEGLSHATTGPRKPTPNSAALGVDALRQAEGSAKGTIIAFKPGQTQYARHGG
jgi:outer membrane protein